MPVQTEVTINGLAAAFVSLVGSENFVAQDAGGATKKVPASVLAAFVLASPALTGTPSVPKAAAGTSTTQIATTAFVTAALNALVNAAPGALDTLKELADALGDDPNFAATMSAALAAKAPLASPVLTGAPTAPTPAAGDSSTKLATTAFVQGALTGTALALAANTTLTPAHRAAFIEASNTITLAFAAAATLGNTWRAWVGNVGTGIVTLDPNGTELIEGLQTLKLYPGERVEVFCDGAQFYCAGLRDRVLLQALTPAASYATFTVFDSARFSRYEIALVDVVPQTDGTDLWLKASQDGGATFLGAGNYGHQRLVGLAGAASSVGNDTDAFILLAGAVSSGSGRSLNGIVDVFFNTAGLQADWHLGYATPTPNVTTVKGHGRVIPNANALQILTAAGLIASGSVRLSGLR